MTSAVLVIDVQSALFDNDPHPWDGEGTIRRINRITAQARETGVPVIFIQHEAPGSALEVSTEGWQLVADRRVESSDLFVRKTTSDSFLRTDLGAVLKEREITDLIICGYATEFCVDTTTRRAADLGYSVQLAADAHTTHDKPHAAADEIRRHHNQTLPSIKSFGVEISSVDSEDIIFRADP